MKQALPYTKLIFLQNHTTPTNHTPCLLLLLSFSLLALFAFASLLTASNPSYNLSINTPLTTPQQQQLLASPAVPQLVWDTLLKYSISSNSTGKMPESDIRAVSSVLRRRGPCNLLVFGLGPETALWRALNHGGRTVFVDESEYYVQHVESLNPPGLEAYDVAYATRVGDLPELIASAREQRRGECRPVQNLLFSDCRLAINDLPNELYDVAWDVILVDGPKGFSGSSPGRMAPIFTAGVLARRGGGVVDVLVHDFQREVERVCSHEFLCRENLVMRTRDLGHFVVAGAAAGGDEFCAGNGTVASG